MEEERVEVNELGQGSNTELYALLMWGGLLASFFTGIAFIIPIVLWIVKKDDVSYVNEQGKDIVNMMISMFLYSFISIIIGVVTFGIGLIILAPLLAVFYFVIFIIGLVKGLNKEIYYTPLTIRFIK